MKFEDRLIEKAGRESGQRVPEGYFEEFYAQMATKLPEKSAAPAPAKLTRWQRMRPYVYLAAMFAGIWCMMQMFHIMSDRATLTPDNPPALVAQAISDPGSDPLNLESYGIPESSSDYEVEKEVIESYNGIEELAADFNYTFDPKYSEIELTEPKRRP